MLGWKGELPWDLLCGWRGGGRCSECIGAWNSYDLKLMPSGQGRCLVLAHSPVGNFHRFLDLPTGYFLCVSLGCGVPPLLDHIRTTFSPRASSLWDCTTPVGWPLGRFIYKMTLGRLLSKEPSFGPREPRTFVPLLVDKQFTPNVAFSLILFCQAQ